MSTEKRPFLKRLVYGIVKLFFLILPLLVAVILLGIGISIFPIGIGLVLYYFLFNRINRKNHRIRNSLNGMPNAPYAGEAGIVNALADRATGSNPQDFFPASFPPEEINIKVYRDTDESLVSHKTFNFDYINKTNPLLEKELFKQLEKVLQKHGLTRAEKNPQITISMDFFIGKREQYTPPQTVTSTELQYVWNFGQFGGNWGGFSSAVPITSSGTIPGYTTTTYYSNIRLNFLNHAKLAEGAKLGAPPLIWLGEADSEGQNSDIRGIAPVMFEELIGEFPDKSSKSLKRYATRFLYGGLGLEFDATDWRIVRSVEPFSVAAEHGIKPGDVLMKINGNRTVINWAGRDKRYLKNPGAWRSRDPYFQYVLSNHGDSDVELLIQSAETGKMVTLNVRPRREDHCIHVDITHSIQKIAGANPIGIIFVIIVTAIFFYYIFLR